MAKKLRCRVHPKVGSRTLVRLSQNWTSTQRNLCPLGDPHQSFRNQVRKRSQSAIHFYFAFISRINWNLTEFSIICLEKKNRQNEDSLESKQKSSRFFSELLSKLSKYSDCLSKNYQFDVIWNNMKEFLNLIKIRI